MSIPMLRVELPDRLRGLHMRKDFKIMHGGRAGAKSWSIARFLLAKGYAAQTRILCAREIQKSLAQSVYQLLKDQIVAMGLSGFYDCQRDKIIGRNGTQFLFTGLQDHTMASLKSYESVDICWVEEAHSVSEDSWQVLTPTIRKPGSEIWASFNPDLPEDYVYKRWIAGRPVDAVMVEPGIWEWESSVVMEVNWRDNPWFTKKSDDERRYLQALNEDVYQHVWEGKCRSAAGLMFKRAWFKRYEPGKYPAELSVYMASDYAVTEDGGDFTVHGVFGIDCDGAIWVLDWWYGQTAPEAWIQAAVTLIRRWKPSIWFEEMGVIRKSQDAAISKRLLEMEPKVWVHRVGLPSTGNKAARALGFAGRASAGAVWVPMNVNGYEWAERLVNQLCGFTGQPGKVDDDVDVCSLVARGLDQTMDARPVARKEERKIPKFGTEEWWEWAEKKDAVDEAAKKRYYA